MTESRIIKKYPNRRLYDTAISSYITLADVKNLVLDGVEFQVVDAKTREDLTRTILLQIISEEEEGGEPIFSSQLLAQLIRSYGGNMQNMLTNYLEKSLELWADQQRVFHERTRELIDHNPVNLMTQIAERNLQMWRQMGGFESWESWGGGSGSAGSAKSDGNGSNSSTGEPSAGGASGSGQSAGKSGKRAGNARQSGSEQRSKGSSNS
ncbi:polyhydroxyalkanoate synthesis repressor PhaR [Halorhodospira halochloris]|uniref:PhbF n=1 Tax=Halorhodospira halochloris TaxID=1052 RepID=A0A0X8X7A3_HALHR|nr:polyhydroxyalkanoate synthesis repressor PhaR [Halorhodospira halochloris]MCG5530661.1 polyhydroxyalkanoate synthesis repressor PhaR [Halorhodospira halochloris]MCG5548352.1 polyhydroxyalkanoate synthesis repressor PhaR [Halorhodospira halochloris]BAU56925.1 PhbF [Halorhodospira halochloris]